MTNGNKSQNKITYLIMIICVWGGYLFGDYYFQITENTVTIYEYDSTYTETTKLQKPIIVSKPTNKPTNGTKINITKSDGVLKTKDKEGKQPVHKYSSGITQQRLENIGIQSELAKLIIKECNTARNKDHCIYSLVSVSNSESSIFKRCSMNNCFGIMYKGKLRSYKTIDDNIKHWVEIYNKYRYTNKTARDWLVRSRYCTSECKHREKNFVYGYNLLEI